MYGGHHILSVYSPWAAITKNHRLEWPRQQKCISHTLGAGNSKIRCHQGWFLIWTLFLGGLDCWLLTTVCSHQPFLCAYVERETHSVSLNLWVWGEDTIQSITRPQTKTLHYPRHEPLVVSESGNGIVNQCLEEINMALVYRRILRQCLESFLHIISSFILLKNVLSSLFSFLFHSVFVFRDLFAILRDQLEKHLFRPSACKEYSRKWTVGVKLQEE